MKPIIFEKYSLLIQYIILLFLVGGILLLLSTAYFQHKINKTERQHLINTEILILKSEKEAVYNRINKITGDLLFLEDTLKIAVNYDSVEKVWVAFSDRKKIYDQIEYIDVEGNEVIYVDYQDDQSILPDKKNLQNQKDQIFFQKTIQLEENQIYISSFENKVEDDLSLESENLVLRVSIPFYDENEVLRGILVLNYEAIDLFDRIEGIAEASSGDISFVNKNGFWIYDKQEPEITGGFLYPERELFKFQNKYSEIWDKILASSSGYAISEKGLFVYTKTFEEQEFDLLNSEYSIVFEDQDWIFISYVEADGSYLMKSDFLTLFYQVLIKYYYLYFVLGSISIILAIMIVINREEKERTKYYSEIDAMTGVFNRRTGFEKIRQIFAKKEKENFVSSLCFLDINGLKEVNDHLGHDAGDELILTVVHSIQNNIRENDFIARLGGDEFLIIFERMTPEEAEEIWNRIKKEYETINRSGIHRYNISVSHGIESIVYTPKEEIDVIINRADEKMYDEKKRIKKEIEIIR